MGNYCSTRRKSVTGSKSALIRWKDDSPTSITVSETQNRKQVSSSTKPSSSSTKSSSTRGATDTKYTKPVTPVSDADKENVSRNAESTPTSVENGKSEETVKPPSLSLEEKFEQKAKFIAQPDLKKVGTDNEKLEFYGLYKQVTVGDNNTSKPWGWGAAGYKWDAWKKREGMSKDTAMREYIEKVADFRDKYDV